MYDAANVIFSAFLCLFQGYCLQYFYGSFLESRTLNSWKSSWAVAVLYAAFRMALTWSGPLGWDYRMAVGKLAVGLGILTALALCFYKAFHLITVFLVAAFQAAADISRYTTVILLGEMGDGLLAVWNWCAKKGAFTSEKAFGAAVHAGLLIEWGLVYLTMALFLYFALKKIVGDFHEKDYSLSRTELLFILTPAAVGLMICMLLRIIIIAMEDGVPKILYDRYPVLIVVIPAILLLSLLSILYGVKLFQDMIYLNRERSSRIVFEKQVKSLQEHIEEMERMHSGIRRMKHDMKNTIFVMQRLLIRNEAGENKELQDYLSELNQAFEELEIRFKTGNAIVDTLLNMKYHEAAQKAPGLEMDADSLLLPKELEIHSYDIGVILGNALDNAIEACGKLRQKETQADAFIRLSSLRKGNLLILKIENSFDGRLAKRGRGEFPATDKADKDSHGIGLSSIKSIAEKYQGTMDYKIEGRVFILSVMMKCQRSGGASEKGSENRQDLTCARKR